MIVYVCGDSFSTPDPEYGSSWTDIMSQTLEINNLSRVSASNLQIALQVDRAIEHRADFIIYTATSCTREELKMSESFDTDLLTRYETGSLVSWTIHNVDAGNFREEQKRLIRDYHREFFDLDTAVYRNLCVIERTLQRLQDSGVDFLFDRGGFEHPRFGIPYRPYFNKWSRWFSEINLWDYGDPKKFRPYHHITDINTHQNIANYYAGQILKT